MAATTRKSKNPIKKAARAVGETAEDVGGAINKTASKAAKTVKRAVKPKPKSKSKSRSSSSKR